PSFPVNRHLRDAIFGQSVISGCRISKGDHGSCLNRRSGVVDSLEQILVCFFRQAGNLGRTKKSWSNLSRPIVRGNRLLTVVDFSRPSLLPNVSDIHVSSSGSTLKTADYILILL